VAIGESLFGEFQSAALVVKCPGPETELSGIVNGMCQAYL